ncbi:MAG: hypothetical protein ACLQFW_23995 [Xanthobacteraceae bacterium]
MRWFSQIGAADRLLQRPLHQQKRAERADIGERQAQIDFRAEHQRVEDQPEKQLQGEFKLVDQAEEALERFAGEKRLDLLARGLVAEQLHLVAVLARKAQHELPEAAIAGALGENPADNARHIGRGLRAQNPDQIVEQEMAGRHFAAGIDHQPGRRGGEHRLGDHQRQHHEQRRAEQIARQLDP